MAAKERLQRRGWKEQKYLKGRLVQALLGQTCLGAGLVSGPELSRGRTCPKTLGPEVSKSFRAGSVLRLEVSKSLGPEVSWSMEIIIDKILGESDFAISLSFCHRVAISSFALIEKITSCILQNIRQFWHIMLADIMFHP